MISYSIENFTLLCKILVLEPIPHWPKTFLKILFATYLTSQTSASLACTGIVVKSIAGEKKNFDQKFNFYGNILLCRSDYLNCLVPFLPNPDICKINKTLLNIVNMYFFLI